MTVLRESVGLSVDLLAEEWGICSELLHRYELREEDIEKELNEKKRSSILFTAAAFYNISLSDLLSIGLFYHVPIKNVHVCENKLKQVLKQYNAGQLYKYKI